MLSWLEEGDVRITDVLSWLREGRCQITHLLSWLRIKLWNDHIQQDTRIYPPPRSVVSTLACGIGGYGLPGLEDNLVLQWPYEVDARIYALILGGGIHRGHRWGGYNTPGEEDKSWYPPNMVIVTFLFLVRITDVLFWHLPSLSRDNRVVIRCFLPQVRITPFYP